MPDAPVAPDPINQPSRVGRLLDLVRKLIDYGKEIAATLRQPSASTDLAATTLPFGTRDIALILARITRGLQRANALEERLHRNGPRLDAPARPRGPAAPETPVPAPRSQAASQTDPRLANLPAPEQIAAEVRRRPIGAVIADICRDLGIMPCHPLWRELYWAIIRYGGSVARLVKDILDRTLPLAIPDDVTPVFSPAPSPVCTGPP